MRVEHTRTMSAAAALASAIEIPDETMEDVIYASQMVREDVQLANMIGQMVRKVQSLRVAEKLTAIDYEVTESDLLDALSHLSLGLYDPRYPDADRDPLNAMAVRNIEEMRAGLIDVHRRQPLTEVGNQLRACFNQLSLLVHRRLVEFRVGQQAAGRIIEAHGLLHDVINEYLDSFELIPAAPEAAPAA